MQVDSRPKSKDIVSVAVKIGKESKLFKLNQALPLQDIIKLLCKDNNIEYIPDHYALQVTDTKEGNINKYITERNRTQYITDGSELRLIYSATEMCRLIHEKMKSEDELLWALEKLCTLSKDPTFSEEFISSFGVANITSLIEKARHPFDTLYFCVETILSFFNLNILPSLDEIPFKSLVNFVAPVSTVTVSIVPEVVTEAILSLFRAVVRSKESPMTLCNLIRSQVTVNEVINLLWSKGNPSLQEKALAYINVISTETDGYPVITKKEALKVLEVLWKNVVMNSTVSPTMAHELYVYQSIVLKFLSGKLNSNIEMNSDEALKLQELCSISYSYEQHIKRDSIVSLLDETNSEKLSLDVSSARSSAYDCDGSGEKLRTPTTPRSPSADSDNEYNETLIPYHRSHSFSLDISHLTLDCMSYFEKKRRKTFTKIMLMETKVQQKPFCAICDRLVHLLCDVLQVGQKPSENSTCYQPLLFEASEESPFFEELFIRVAIRLTSTSKEMKARTSQDYEKALNVLRHQVMTVLQMQLSSWKKLDEELQKVTYEKVVESWQTENDQNLMKLQDSPAVIELRENFRPLMEEIISKHRLNLLCKGARFIKPNPRGQKLKKKFWFIYLSPNHTVFHYGDCNESDVEIDCSSKLSVSSIRELLVGRKCPHVREAKNNRKAEPEFAFSLMLDHEEHTSLDFIAPTQEVYDYWTDGLSFLLGNKMKSKSMKAELKNLLDMEVRLHLLELEGIDLPHTTPVIPEAPPNFNFNIM